MQGGCCGSVPPQLACLRLRRYVYQHMAARELGKTTPFGVLSAGEWLRGKGHAVRSQFSAAKGAIDLMQVNPHPPSSTPRVPLAPRRGLHR